ncbi:MAG: ROK family protein [Spirochaetaceae bacterium]|nr:ROK family protein [Spirochaetaceae bacterium]
MTAPGGAAKNRRPKPPVLALDMGGSKFITGLVSEDGKILRSRRQNWSETAAGKTLSAEGLLADIYPAIRNMLALADPAPLILGAAIPGLADPSRGLWVEASFSGIRDFPVASILEKEFGLSVKIENDVNACALAERKFGCCGGPGCEPVDDFLWVTVSNGIGGCIFARGKLYTGFSGNAGEIGHVIVEEGPGARPCKAGHRGCAEMHASGRGLAKNYLALGGSRTAEGTEPDAKAIEALARKGDPAAIRTYQLEGLYLGRAIGAAVNLLNPGRVIIGGGVSLGYDLFKVSLEETLETHVYKNANPRLRVEPSPLGYNAALLGAAALGLEEG